MSVMNSLRKPRGVTESGTDSHLPKHHHTKQRKRVVGKKKKYLNTFTYTRFGVYKTKKKDGGIHIGNFQLFWKRKVYFSLKKNIKSKFPDAVAQGLLPLEQLMAQIHIHVNWYFTWNGFPVSLSLQFVTSQSLLSSFWTDIIFLACIYSDSLVNPRISCAWNSTSRTALNCS